MVVHVSRKSLSAGYIVKDAQGNDRWTVREAPFSWRKKLYVYDADGNDAAFLCRINTKYYIEVPGEPHVALAREPRSTGWRFHLEGLPWRLEDDAYVLKPLSRAHRGVDCPHEFTLFAAGEGMMRVSRDWLFRGCAYRLEIANPRRELLCLCIVIALDCEIEREKAKASGGG